MCLSHQFCVKRAEESYKQRCGNCWAQLKRNSRNPHTPRFSQTHIYSYTHILALKIVYGTYVGTGKRQTDILYKTSFKEYLNFAGKSEKYSQSELRWEDQCEFEFRAFRMENSEKVMTSLLGRPKEKQINSKCYLVASLSFETREGSQREELDFLSRNLKWSLCGYELYLTVIFYLSLVCSEVIVS